MTALPITEMDLHAYVDKLLPEARRAEVEVYLANNPEEAERLQAYQAQNLALKDLFNPLLDEPIPEKMLSLASQPVSVTVDAKKRPFFSRWSLERIAAGLLIAVVSGVSGWLAHGQ